MRPRPHDGPADEGLSSSLLRIVHDPERVDGLRMAISGFCHRCRNSLNGIKMSLYLFRRGARGTVPGCCDELEAIYQQVVQLFDHLQVVYRPMPLTMVRSPVDDLIRQHAPRWRAWYEYRGLSLRIVPPGESVPGEFDPAQLGMGLDALAAWRAEACAPGTSTRVSWSARDGVIELRWEERPSPDVGDPSARFVEERRSGRLDLLELPLLARIIGEHGGHLDASRDGPFRLVLRWPGSRPLGAVCDA